MINKLKKIRLKYGGYSFGRFARFDNPCAPVTLTGKKKAKTDICAYLDNLMENKGPNPPVIIKLFSAQPFIHNSDSWDDERLADMAFAIDYISAKYPDSHVNVVIDQTAINRALKCIGYSGRINVYSAKNIFPIDNNRILANLILKNDSLYAHETAVFLNVNFMLKIAGYLQSGTEYDFILFYSDCGSQIKTALKLSGSITVNDILDYYKIHTRNVTVIENGVITGNLITDYTQKISETAESIIVLENRKKKSFLMPFLRMGIGLDSYTNSFFPSSRMKIEPDIYGGLRPCINCGYCAQVCPAGIYPSVVYNMINCNMFEESLKMRVLNCVDCGLCSYVCPSKIPVAENLKSGKEQIFSQCALILENKKQ